MHMYVCITSLYQCNSSVTTNWYVYTDVNHHVVVNRCIL